MKLVIGLVVKGGKEFIDKWITTVETLQCGFIVVDNNADQEVRDKLINHKQLLQYHIQTFTGRNQSRDYQKILEMAREENATWVWNLDADECTPEIDVQEFYGYLLNTNDNSVGFPLFEMRNDDKHYILLHDNTPQLKHARGCHKLYKVLSHFEFDRKDKHGISIPHNCSPGDVYFMPIQHFGHMTKEQRDKKREEYKKENFKDECELSSDWLKEDDDVEIKEWGAWSKK